MNIIINHKFKWKEPKSFYQWQRTLSYENTPKWRLILGYSIMVFGPATVLIPIIIIFRPNMDFQKLLFLICMMVFIPIIFLFLERFTKGEVWILNNRITHRINNSYTNWYYKNIKEFSVVKEFDGPEPYDYLVLNHDSGDKNCVVLSPVIDQNQLLHFLKGKIKNSN